MIISANLERYNKSIINLKGRSRTYIKSAIYNIEIILFTKINV